MQPTSPMWDPSHDRESTKDHRFTLTDYAQSDMEEKDIAGPSTAYTTYRDPRPLPDLPKAASPTSRSRVHYEESLGEGSYRSRDNPPSAIDEFSAGPSRHSISPLPSLSRSFDTSQLEAVQDEEPEKEKESVGFDLPAMLPRGAIKREQSELSQNTGKTSMIPSSWPCRLLLLTVVLQAVLDLCIEGNILWRFNDQIDSTDDDTLENANKNRLPVYLIIFGLAHLWQLILTIMAVRTKNTIQVIAVTAFNLAFLAYAIIQIQELRQILGENFANGLASNGRNLLTLPLNILTALIVSIIAVCSVGMVVLAFLIRKEFGWQRYKFLGADLQIRKYYLRFQVFECICYFSAFFCAGFGIQFLWLALDPQDDKAEYIITWIMFILSVVLLVIGRFAAKYENKPFMAFFGVGLLLGMAYFIFKLVRIWQERTSIYLSVTKSLTVFDILSLCCLIACFVYGVMVYLDFGNGLKTAVLSKPGTLSTFFRIGGSRWSSSQAGESEMEVVPKRLTIS